MQFLDLYEQKVIDNKEFPVQLQINEITKKGVYFSSHWHEHTELHYILEGSTRFRLNQKEIVAEKGNLVIVNGNELHEGYCDGRPVSVLVIIFEMAALSEELAEKNIILKPWIKKDSVVDDIAKEIYEEYDEKKVCYQLVCKGALLQLISHLVRNYTEEILSENDSNKRKKKLERLNTVINHIEENYPEPISNKDLADLIHLSEDRFNHLFKESMDKAPLQYINEIRLRKAMHMLKKNNLPVSEVALAVGFQDYNHFGRMFRKQYGRTPMEIRNNN